MPKYWLISDRNNNGTGQGMNTAGLTYWVSDGGDLTSIDGWQKVRTQNAFQKLHIADEIRCLDFLPA